VISLRKLPERLQHLNLYIYYYAEAANSGQNHTVQHNTAQLSQIKKGTYNESNQTLSLIESHSTMFCTSHHITSHGENGSRPQRPLYPRNNDRVHFILHKILYYSTTVSDAMEICFVIIHHVFIDPEFI